MGFTIGVVESKDERRVIFKFKHLDKEYEGRSSYLGSHISKGKYFLVGFAKEDPDVSILIDTHEFDSTYYGRNLDTLNIKVKVRFFFL